MRYDKIIIGAGLYGLFAAERCGRRGEKVLVLECDAGPFMRATFINQARVHMGYHYPRSLSTAIKSAGYFERFMQDYSFCVKQDFDQIYAISRDFSWTNAEQFKRFCSAANIRCDWLDPDVYFNAGLCEAAFMTTEYTYDAQILKKHFLEKLGNMPNVEIRYRTMIERIEQKNDVYVIAAQDQETSESEFILNATYASTNQITSMLGFEPFRIKYELCEIILCHVEDRFKNIGITVMDGPFFSIMPFGCTGLHSLTSVTFTPHISSFNTLPQFNCQEKSEGYCTPQHLGNCDECRFKPASSWTYMSSLAKKYLRKEYGFTYYKSLFSMKPILKASEVDDSRPTVVRTFSRKPTFVSVLSGKINTVYDLEGILDGEE